MGSDGPHDSRQPPGVARSQACERSRPGVFNVVQIGGEAETWSAASVPLAIDVIARTRLFTNSLPQRVQRYSQERPDIRLEIDELHGWKHDPVLIEDFAIARAVTKLAGRNQQA